MDDASSLPGQTLAPVYLNNTNLMTFMYNDEKPEGPTSFDLGHTKVNWCFTSKWLLGTENLAYFGNTYKIKGSAVLFFA